MGEFSEVQALELKCTDFIVRKSFCLWFLTEGHLSLYSMVKRFFCMCWVNDADFGLLQISDDALVRKHSTTESWRHVLNFPIYLLLFRFSSRDISRVIKICNSENFAGLYYKQLLPAESVSLLGSWGVREKIQFSTPLIFALIEWPLVNIHWCKQTPRRITVLLRVLAFLMPLANLIYKDLLWIYTANFRVRLRFFTGPKGFRSLLYTSARGISGNSVLVKYTVLGRPTAIAR